MLTLCSILGGIIGTKEEHEHKLRIGIGLAGYNLIHMLNKTPYTIQYEQTNA